MRICRCPRPAIRVGTAAICVFCTGVVPSHHVTRFQGSGHYLLSAAATEQTDSSGPHLHENDFPTYVGEGSAAGTAVAGRFQQSPAQRSHPGAAPSIFLINGPAQRLFVIPAGTASTL
jgi:hypothetical protein